jgi:hypothetical protein
MASTSNYPGLSLEVIITVSPENVSKFLSPGVVHWTKDKKCLLGVQMKKDYYKPYLAATEALFIKDRMLP